MARYSRGGKRTTTTERTHKPPSTRDPNTPQEPTGITAATSAATSQHPTTTTDNTPRATHLAATEAQTGANARNALERLETIVTTLKADNDDLRNKNTELYKTMGQMNEILVMLRQRIEKLEAHN
ncbi:hypothetical protein CONLIGDRAFT_676472 [Coniochaeta ligniaria NRRL 30616]|uniref:Uncharacterized protein n=1 Tax=Coniochaeta ligniaria NRRL 30616 TaxID=1408157 RepID=A0A1J7J7X9_9PEZI|nr:hypothetical protein CONLIGDRAFT_676472 [Coniochaeta ligniaria NRRL 30616]